MRRWKIEPKEESVKKYVACYWFLNRENEPHLNSFPKLSPDTTTHLVLCDPDQTFHFKSDGGSFTGKGSHCVYPHNETFTMNHSNLSFLLGIKFKMGATYSLDIFNFDVKTGCVTEFENSGYFSDLILRISQLTPEEVRDELDKFVLESMSKEIEDSHSKLVRKVIPILRTDAISEIGKQLNRSQRTIERSFLKVTGLNMKQCQAIIRLEEILQDIYNSEQKKQDWAGIASKYGFNDQSHLIRYMKGLINLTPGQYANNREMTLDVYGDFTIK